MAFSPMLPESQDDQKETLTSSVRSQKDLWNGVRRSDSSRDQVDEDAGDSADADVIGVAGAPDSGAGEPNSARFDGTDLTKPGREDLFRVSTDVIFLLATGASYFFTCLFLNTRVVLARK